MTPGNQNSPTPELTCEELVELVTDYLEGSLDRDTEGLFVLHATSCPGCETYLAQFRETVAALGTLPPESLDPRVRDLLLDAFRGWPRISRGGHARTPLDPDAGGSHRSR
jgi:hypothetical protein